MPEEELLSVPIRRKVVAPLPSAIRRGGEATPSRAWSPLGTIGGGAFGEVDRNGALHMAGRTWSLDWWVGAEDRWHFASTEASMRQSAMSDTPVIESLMRVPGGDIVHRVGGVAVGSAGGGGDSTAAVKVQVENRSAVPVALALVLRPWTLDARGSIGEVSVRTDSANPNAANPTAIEVDRRDRLVFDRAPLRSAHGPAALVAPALSEGNDEALLAQYSGVDGDLEVAFVFPLTHTATLGVLVLAPEPEAELPLVGRARRFLFRDRQKPTDTASPTAPTDLMSAGHDPSRHDLSKVVSGWESHGDNDPRISMPIRDWSNLYNWSGAILRLAGTSVITSALEGAPTAPGISAGDRVVATTRELANLDPTACDSIAAALIEFQRLGGQVRLPDGSDASAGLLFAAAGVFRAPWGATRVEEYIGAVAKAVDHVSKSRPLIGHLHARALTAVAPGLVRIGQPEVAEHAIEVAKSAENEDSGNASGERAHPGEGVASEDEISEFRSALAEAALIRSGQQEGLRRLARRINSRGAAGVSDLTDAGGRPVGTSGIDLAELAATRTALGETALVDSIGGPVILPTFAEAWADKPVEARRIATGWGEVSFALRWHDGTPVLLWEVEPWFGARGSGSAPVVRSGLDPAWIGVGWEGESYLDGWQHSADAPG